MTPRFGDFFEGGAEAIEIREHFFECDGDSVWALLVSYRDTTASAPGLSRGDGFRIRGDAKQDLSADELARFEAARAW